MSVGVIMEIISVVEALIGILERNRGELTPEAREALHARTRDMIARAQALATGA